VLGKLGKKDLKWLDGGVLGWSDAGLPTEGK
jgi:rhodanese-related sulfurtransferase